MAKAAGEKTVANVIALFGTQPEVDEEEVPVWLTIGRGKTGKTTLIRFLVEETMGAGRQVLIADVDRTNATLTSYFEGVQRPPEGDESSVSAWLEKLLTFAMAQKLSAYIDLGGSEHGRDAAHPGHR